MNSYLESIIIQFQYCKGLGDKTLHQLPKDKLSWQVNENSNSMATLIKHLHGNMLSRWTDFLTTDGEKEWRKRDEEFDNNTEDLQSKWEEGWDCLFSTLNLLTEKDLEKEVFIRNMGHTVFEAINRQLSHYSYHVGQMVFLGKLIQNEEWETLSIPKGASKDYNQDKFSKPKSTKHFTEDI